MKCPHCGTDFHENWAQNVMRQQGSEYVAGRFPNGGPLVYWRYQTTQCSKCLNVTIEIGAFDSSHTQRVDWRRVYPIAANRGPISPEVPPEIAKDYVEACNVLPISTKASAALSRRCLQNVLHRVGYKARDLNAENDLLLNEPEPKKAIPARLRQTIDAIRHFGNFSAHPIDDKTAPQDNRC